MRHVILKTAAVLGAFVLVALGATRAQAALAITVEPVLTLTAAGATGFVEIVLTNTDSDQTLSAFQLDVALGGTGLTFTGVDDLTSDPYVFAGAGSGSQTLDSFPNTGFNLNDFVLNPPLTHVTLLAGESYGLGRIAFSVDSLAAAGPRPVTLSNPGFFDEAGDPILALVTNGIIEVEGIVGGPLVPEPGTLTMFLAGSALMAGSMIRRKRVR